MSQVWPGFHLWPMLGNRSFVSCVRVLNNKSEAVKESYLRCCRMKFILLLLAVVIFCTCLVINRCSYCPLLLRRYNLINSFIHSFIHYVDLYSASSRLLLRSAPDYSMAKKNSLKARVECDSFIHTEHLYSASSRELLRGAQLRGSFF